MKLHEYQAKEWLKRFGIRVQDGEAVETVEDAVRAAQHLAQTRNTQVWVLKAQIHAGGRGKAGGIQLARSLDEVREKARNLLGKVLVTPQTGPEGKRVNILFVAEDVYGSDPKQHKEYYVSFLVDREKHQPVLIYSREGGVDIEEIAERTPEKIHKEWIHPTLGLQPFQARKAGFQLGLRPPTLRKFEDLLLRLFRAFQAADASLLEVNPLLHRADGELIVVDTKMQIDDNALFRQQELASWRDEREEDPTEVEASKHNLSFVRLKGNIGCMVNGAGLAMATMDIIKYYGGEPANFLDVGGRATAETVAVGFRLILKDPGVRAILVNIFGGIVRCDRVARGILQAIQEIGNVHVPVVVRLQGTNAEEARTLIEQSGMQVYYEQDLDTAARRAVELARAQS